MDEDQIYSCKDCRFHAYSGDELKMGECRRYAPRESSGPDGVAWPKLYDHEWCGEWKSKVIGSLGRLKVTDDQIIEAVVARSGMAWTSMVRAIMTIYKIARSSAQDRLNKLAALGKIRVERLEGVKVVLCEDRDTPPIKGVEPADTRRKWEWEDIAELATMGMAGANRATKYSHMYQRVISGGKPIGGSAFDRIIKEALASGKLVKTGAGLMLPERQAWIESTNGHRALNGLPPLPDKEAPPA